MTKKLERLIRDPQSEFHEPADIISRSDLSSQEKLTVLESWQADLIELQKALDENMSGTGEPGETATKLAQVTAAITQVKEEEE